MVGKVKTIVSVGPKGTLDRKQMLTFEAVLSVAWSKVGDGNEGSTLSTIISYANGAEAVLVTLIKSDSASVRILLSVDKGSLVSYYLTYVLIFGILQS